MPILFWHVKYKENMKKNDHHSNIGALKIRTTTQNNGVKLQHNKILNGCYQEENAFWNSLLSKENAKYSDMSNSLSSPLHDVFW